MKKPGGEQIVLEMLDEIERARSHVLSLDELEERLWRHLDAAGNSIPPTVASKVEDMVLELRRLRDENLSFGHSRDAVGSPGTELEFAL